MLPHGAAAPRVCGTHLHAGQDGGIFGQAPSEYPEMAKYRLALGIDSISVTPDTPVKITRDGLAVEQRLGLPPLGYDAAGGSS